MIAEAVALPPVVSAERKNPRLRVIETDSLFRSHWEATRVCLREGSESAGLRGRTGGSVPGGDPRR